MPHPFYLAVRPGVLSAAPGEATYIGQIRSRRATTAMQDKRLGTAAKLVVVLDRLSACRGKTIRAGPRSKPLNHSTFYGARGHFPVIEAS